MIYTSGLHILSALLIMMFVVTFGIFFNALSTK